VILSVGGNSHQFINCAFIGGTAGYTIYASSSSVLAFTNCYFGGETDNITVVDSASVSFTNCATSSSVANDSYAGLTNDVALDTTNFMSVTFGNANYLKLKAGSALIDAGTNMGSSGNWYVGGALDIAGATRSGTWDIGPFEYTSLGQFARPSSDISAGTWEKTPVPVGADLYGKVNETTADDTGFIYSAESPSNDTATLGLSTINTPESGSVTIRVRASIY
jgi:hypothetical protein